MKNSFISSDGFSWYVDSIQNTTEKAYEQWHELAWRSGAPSTAFPLWYASTHKAFGEHDGPVTVHRLYHNGELTAVLPLVRKGLFFKTWFPYQQNLYTPFWAFPFDHKIAGAGKEILQYLFHNACKLDFGFILQNDQSVQRLLHCKKLYKIVLEHSPWEADIYNPLNEDWAFCVSHLSKHLKKKKIEQNIRWLNRRGILKMSVLTGSDELDRSLSECFELEKAGWKGSGGTAILCNPETEVFYRSLARFAAPKRMLAIYTLRLDDKLIAFKLCLRAARRIEILKMAYDEYYSKGSPGNVLGYMIMETECQAGNYDSLHWGSPDTPEQAKDKMSRSDCSNTLARVLIFKNSFCGKLYYFCQTKVKRAVTLLKNKLKALKKQGQ